MQTVLYATLHNVADILFRLCCVACVTNSKGNYHCSIFLVCQNTLIITSASAINPDDPAVKGRWDQALQLLGCSQRPLIGKQGLFDPRPAFMTTNNNTRCALKATNDSLLPWIVVSDALNSDYFQIFF